MKMIKTTSVCCLLFSLAVTGHSLGAQNQDEYLKRSTFVGQADSSLPMKSMLFNFRVQNEQELKQLLEDQQDGNSPRFHQWITPEEFGRRFGVSEEMFQEAILWLKDQGFLIVHQFPNHLSIFFEGTAGQVERAFAVSMGFYELGGKKYYSNDRIPTIPEPFQKSALGVFNLDNFPRIKSLFTTTTGVRAMAPADMAVAYNLMPLYSKGINGTGQSIAIIGRSDFNISDIQTFRSTFNLPANDPQKIFSSTNPGITPSATEAVLDAEWAGAIAPNATIKVVISAIFEEALNFIVNSLPSSHVISMSLGSGESGSADSNLTSTDQTYAQAASQGQSVFVSSGDQGAQQAISSGLSSGADVNGLCTSPNSTCVGGTSLIPPFDVNGNVTGYGPETAWQDSGGGKSRFFAKPAYQSGPGVPADGMRDVPDVSLMANPGQQGVFLYKDGTLQCCFGGTSLSAPVWAGFFALVNQAGTGNGVGNANPRIYELARNQFAGGPAVFHDVTSGNNNTSTVTGFTAGPGYDQVTGWGSFDGNQFVTHFAPGSGNSSLSLALSGGGAVSASTIGGSGSVQAGDATVNVNSGNAPYGTAVFSFTSNGFVVSEAGVPASPPTPHAEIFIDFRSGVSAKGDQFAAGTINIDTGFAVVNRNSVDATVTYILRQIDGTNPITGHGIISAGTHRALFIDQLNSIASDFALPGNFSTITQFGSLEIQSTQPLSILALRLTTNQRGDTLLTSTPIADLTRSPSTAPLDFPQIVDGGGYTSTFVLLNTSGSTESGTLQLFTDTGGPLSVRPVNGSAQSSFPYNIPPGGVFLFQTDGSPAGINAGSVQVIPNPGTSTPVGAGVFRLTQNGIVVTESGIPSATPTTHARIYVDESGGHDTGLAIAAPNTSPLNVVVNAFQTDGVTTVGASLGPVALGGNGHTARFVGQLVSGLPSSFTGVLDISSASPFVALTLRLLNNGRDSLLTTFPIADFNQPAPTPIVFPQIANAGPYRTQFILLSAGGAASTTLNLFDDNGQPLAIAKSARSDR